MMENKKTDWTREEINRMLDDSPAAVEQAIIRLWERQTQREKDTSTTQLHNTVGFCAFSARSGTKLARFILSARKKGTAKGSRLFAQNMEKARRIAKRHSKQLVDIANGA